jgi:hypothetical protein
MSGIEEFLRANGPDITGTAGDKNVHGSSIKYFRAGERRK